MSPLVRFWFRLSQPELGDAIALLRERFGLSRERLIQRMWDISQDEDLGVDEVLIYRWERGDKKGHRNRPGPRYRELLGRVCEREAESLNVVARHEFVKELAALDLPWIGSGAAESYSLSNAASPLSAADVSPITARFQYLRNRISGANLIGPVRAHIDFIAGHLRERSLTAGSRAGLVSGLGEASVLAGVLSYWDLDDERAARQYLHTAVTAAREAQDQALGAFVMGFTAELETYIQQPVRAIELNRAAQRIAVKITSPRMRSWLAASEAQACAHAEIEDSYIFRVLERAREEMARTESDPYPQWMMFFDPARLAGYEGASLVKAGHPHRALETLRQAATNTDGALKNYHAYIAADMAWGFAQQGELEESCHHLATAFDLANALNYRDGLRRVLNVRQQLDQWNDTPAVRQLDEQLKFGWVPLGHRWC
jgi:hypothetical protein